MAIVTDKSLFIHVPKTGGSSVRSMMAIADIGARESGPFNVEDHYGLPELRAAHPGIDAGRTTFGFVREPVAWLKSRWAWAMVSGLMDKVVSEPAAARHWIASCWSYRFDEFAEHYLERYAGVYTQTVFGMLGIWSGAPVMQIGRTENLIPDLVAILEMAGEKFDAAAFQTVTQEKKAASGDLAERCIISRALSNRILRAEPLMCERFGY